MPIAIGTDIGKVRDENQDRVAIMRVNASSSANPFVVVALADGMGGMSNGGVCAARTLGGFLNALIRFRHSPPEYRLNLAVNAANEFVHEYSLSNGGATLSALLIDDQTHAFLLNVGDSRIYATLKDLPDRNAERLTVDDSLEEAVGGHGKELLQFIGMGDGLVPHISSLPAMIDKAVITSDGVHFIGLPLLSEALLHAERVYEVPERLITLATWKGAPDNASSAAIFFSDLAASISASQETGVELWDPFGALHVMWAKQELAELQPPRQAALQVLRTDSAISETPADTRPTKSKSGKKSNPKPRTPRAPRTTKSAQLTIEIEPLGTPSSERKDMEDNETSK